MSTNGKRTISVGRGEEHASLREALRGIRDCVSDPRRRERVESELFAAMLAEGSLSADQSPSDGGTGGGEVPR